MTNLEPKLIKIEIILHLAKFGSGADRRKAFLLKIRDETGWIKKVNEEFEESLTRRRKSLGNEGKGDKGLSTYSVEKCLSDLKNEGYIESIPEKVSHPREYRLKCNNLSELFRVFDFLYRADRKLANMGNNYERLRELVASPFFAEAWERCIFDLIYYFDLWDELTYPINEESYFQMIADQVFFSKLPISYKLDYTNPETGGYFTRKENERPYVAKDYPNYFRSHFPGVGPCKYEEYLRSHKLQGVLLERLVELEPSLGIDGFIQLSKFLMKYLGDGFDYKSIRVSEIDFWFNDFWYGIIKEMDDLFRRYIPWENQHKNLCIVGLGRINKGYHGYENFRPLIIAKKLLHLSLCSSSNRELDELSYGYIPHSEVMDLFGHYPKFTRYRALKAPNEPGIFLTDSGALFIDKLIQSITKDVWFPAPLINFIEYFLQFPCKLSIRPSMMLYDVRTIAGRMQFFDKWLANEINKAPEDRWKKMLISNEERRILITHWARAEPLRIERISAWDALRLRSSFEGKDIKS